MNLTKEQLDAVEENAGLQFLPDQIAIIIGVDPDKFYDEIEEGSGDIYLSYMRGQLKSEAEVRKAMLEVAKGGSVPAQKQILEIIAKNKE